MLVRHLISCAACMFDNFYVMLRDFVTALFNGYGGEIQHVSVLRCTGYRFLMWFEEFNVCCHQGFHGIECKSLVPHGLLLRL